MFNFEDLHAEAVAVGLNRAQAEHLLGGLLLRLEDARIWEQQGIGSFAEYAERHLHLRPRELRERLRIAKQLDELPRIDAAMAEGTLPFSAVRELSRVVVPKNEEEWLNKAVGRTIRDVELLVSGRKPGDGPEDPPSPKRRRVVVETSPAVYALYREAQAKLRKDSDEELDDEDMLMLMCRLVLGGPADEGRSPYQIRVTVCERCERAEQTGRGQSIPVEPVATEQAFCDAQRVDSSERATQTIPPATRRLVVDRQHGRCGVPGCQNAVFTEVHHIRYREDGGDHAPDELILLCGAHHRAQHRGTLRIEGSWSSGLRFLHADGSPYGALASPRLAGMMSDLHSGLRHLGFKDRECRAMVDSIRPHAVPTATLQDLFKMALQSPRGIRELR